MTIQQTNEFFAAFTMAPTSSLEISPLHNDILEAILLLGGYLDCGEAKGRLTRNSMENKSFQATRKWAHNDWSFFHLLILDFS